LDYVHQELGQEIRSISGAYTPLKELRLEHNGGDILSVIGLSLVDTACCGSGSFLYATVPGYILAWKARTNESGLPVSQVEPLRDELTRREISKMLRETEHIYHVNFL
jgi:hypothetical protein